jgi:tartrate dehydrogenase/decarboxylase / D-malate dehydrogenase
MSVRIAVIPGDGVGLEVVPEGVRVLQKVNPNLQFDYFDWGSRRYHEVGAMRPEDGLDQLADYAAVLLGSIGWPTVPDHISLWEGLMPLRKVFDLYVNLRPVKLLPGLRGPLADRGPSDVDMLFVRENTEGEYSGAGGIVHGAPGPGGAIHTIGDHEIAVEVPVFTSWAIERCARYAFEQAVARSGRLISVTKSNASRFNYVLWDRVVDRVAADYPSVTVEKILVDAMAARMVLRPDTVDVVVASNLFGDILTDLGSALQGSLGLGASGNINPERAWPSVFEPIHGSAPDIAGKGVANPLGAILSAAMLLQHVGDADGASRIEAAVARVCADRRVLTRDLGGTASTNEVGDAVVMAIASNEAGSGVLL